jgi:RimJ/RimL family protein N-acetyltransferase
MTLEARRRPYSISTLRCILKEMRTEDAAFWFAFMSSPPVIRYLPDRIMSLEQMSSILAWLVANYEKGLRHAERVTLAVHLRDAPQRPIGWVTAGPLPEDERLREIGYALEPAMWGRGLATEAVRGFAAWVQRYVTDEPLYATVDARNAGSIRVLEKLGMARVRDSHLGAIVPAENHILYCTRPSAPTVPRAT